MRYFYTSEKCLNIARVQTDPTKAPAVEVLGPDGKWVFSRSAAEKFFSTEFGEPGKEIDEATALELVSKRLRDAAKCQ